MTLRLVGHRHGEGPRRDVTDGQGARNADSVIADGAYAWQQRCVQITQFRTPDFGGKR